MAARRRRRGGGTVEVTKSKVMVPEDARIHAFANTISSLPL